MKINVINSHFLAGCLAGSIGASELIQCRDDYFSRALGGPVYKGMAIRSASEAGAAKRSAREAPDTGLPESASAARRPRIILLSREDNIVFDSDFIIPDADLNVLVIDPLPSELMLCAAAHQEMILSDPDLVIVINKMNPGVRKSQLTRYLSRKDLIYLPFAEPRYIYQAEYSSSLPIEVPQLKEQLEPAIKEILSRAKIKDRAYIRS